MAYNPFDPNAAVSAINSGTTLTGASPGYSYQPNGNGGVNYFYNGQPITNTQYQSANPSQDTGSIEQYAKEMHAFNTTGQVSQANGQVASGPTQSVQAADIPAPSPQNTGVTQSAPATGSGGSSPYPPGYFLHSMMGPDNQTYNLADANQREAYRQAYIKSYGQQRDQAISQLQDPARANLASAADQNARSLNAYNQSAVDYGRGLANNIVDLGQGHDLGQVNQQQYFSGLSPNAFQSGQATSQQYNNDQYQKGITQLHQGEAETVGQNYLSSGQIDPNSKIGSEIGGLGNAYNKFVGDTNRSLDYGTTAANTAYSKAIQDQSNNISNLVAYSGQTQPSYTPVAFDASKATGNVTFNPFTNPNAQQYQPTRTDISQYTPYSNASQLSQAPQAQSPSPATWTGSGTPLSGLLGYNPNNTQTNYLNAFMGRSGTPATASAN
jgi:hypothetical protein